MRSRIMMLFKMVLILIFIFSTIFIYSTFIERHLLTVKKNKIEIIENSTDNLRVIQFTDTQLGEFYNLEQLEKVVEKINKLNPDIVVFTGDLIDNASKYEDLDKVSGVLSGIKATIGKYAIYGNHDYGGGAVRYYKDIMNKSGFEVLKNSNDKIMFHEKSINIMGADDALMGGHSVSKTINCINKDDINILLLHEPDLIEKYKEYPIDLALGGHSHGGQVYIPFYGPIKRNALAKDYCKGMYDINNSRKTKFYVSSGLGNTKLPFRLGNIPEIAVFDLKI